MPTLNATVFPAEAYVLVEVDWSSHPTVTHAIVTRRNTVTGEIVTLRPYIAFDDEGALLLDCSLGLWWDTEPPLNVPLEYCTLAADVATTLTVNPDFETSAAGWNDDGGALTQDCTVAKFGSCSGLLTPDGISYSPSIDQTVTAAFAAGVPLVYSTWARSPLGWNAVFLQLVVTYEDLTTATVTTPVVALDDTEWRFMSGTFTPSLPVTSFRFFFIASGLPPATVLFNVDDIKVTQEVAVTETACETVTVTSESLWLKSPLHPCLDVEIGMCNPMLADCEETDRITYVGMEPDEYAANTVLLNPANRRRPIPVNRIRRDATSTLRLLAHTCEARDSVLAVNEPGDPLLFQVPAQYCIADRYISVGTLTDSHISVDQREEFRLMTLPYAVVDRPEGPADGVCGARIMDLCDIYTSWAAFTIAGFDYTDLLLGLASPDGPGQPDPPADARTWGDVEAEFADWLAVETNGTWADLRDGL